MRAVLAVSIGYSPRHPCVTAGSNPPRRGLRWTVVIVCVLALLQTLGGPAMRPAVATASTILVRLATLWFAVLIGVVALGIYRAFYRPARRLAESS